MQETLASRSTVKRMAAALAKLGKQAFEMTWADVRKLSFQQEMDKHDRKDWKEQKARELADYLVNGPSVTKDPEITARALEMVSGFLPGQLTSEWPDEAREALTAAIQELAPDKAGALAETLEALEAVAQARGTAYRGPAPIGSIGPTPRLAGHLHFGQKVLIY